MDIVCQWTNGSDPVFQQFYAVTEAYYSHIAGGKEKRRAFAPYNASAEIPDAVIAYCGEQAVGCAGLRRYTDGEAEIKRLWVEPAFRRRHIAMALMDRVEEKAKRMGYRRLILQTRPIMPDAVALYTKRGYRQIPNYPPYDRLDGAICFAKEI